MNMMVSTEQQRQAIAYAEVRARLMNPPKAKSDYVKVRIAEIEAAMKADHVEEPKRPFGMWSFDAPLWSWTNMHFDSHVKVWKKIAAIRHSNEPEEVKEIEADFVTEFKRPVREIIAETLGRYPEVTWADVTGAHRNRYVVEARQNCMFELYEQRRDLSFPILGRLFGGRDHTTVLHAVNKIRQQRLQKGQ